MMGHIHYPFSNQILHGFPGMLRKNGFTNGSTGLCLLYKSENGHKLTRPFFHVSDDISHLLYADNDGSRMCSCMHCVINMKMGFSFSKYQMCVNVYNLRPAVFSSFFGLSFCMY